MVAYNGDRGTAGDSLVLTAGDTTTALGDGANPGEDVLNSTISGPANASSARVPAHANTLGYDSDVFGLDGLLTRAGDQAALRLTSQRDARMGRRAVRRRRRPSVNASSRVPDTCVSEEAVPTDLTPNGRPPRVLHLTQPVDGGVARVVTDLVRAQLADGLDVAAVCPDSPLTTRLRSLGAHLRTWEATAHRGPPWSGRYGN